MIWLIERYPYGLIVFIADKQKEEKTSQACSARNGI